MLARLKKYNWLELGLVVLVGIAFYSLHFHPYFTSFSSDIFFFNDPDDAKIYSWNTWHFAHQLSNGNNPFYTDFICWPEGTSLWMHAYTVWFGLLNVFIKNINVSINLGIAIQLVAAFVGFYYLAKRFVMRPYFAATVAYIAVFNTYILAKCGVHYNLVMIGVLPFLLLYIVKLFPIVEERLTVVKKHILSFVVLFVLAFFMEYYMVFYALAFMLVYLMWYGFISTWFDTWSWKKTIRIIGLFGVGHIVMRLLRIGGFQEKGAVWGAADLRLLFTPGSNAANQKEWILEGLSNTLNDNKIYIGISLAVYFIVALIFFYQDNRRDKESRFFLFASVVFLLVTLPVIKIGGKGLFYNFTSIVHYIPFVNNVRAPDRFILLFFVTASLFICRVIFLQTNYSKGWSKYTAFAVTLLAWFYLDHEQVHMNVVEQPLASDILEECRGKTVLMLPFGIRDGYQQFGDFDESQVLQQTQYWFKMPSGYLSRLSDDTWEYYKSNELYINLVNVQKDSPAIDFDWHTNLLNNNIEILYVPKNRSVDSNEIKMLESLPALIKEDRNGTLYTLRK
ncbi:MAG: hypothetical protein ACI9M3_001632 [Bacteroidia bacterium]|jgi:hypothetical protein